MNIMIRGKNIEVTDALRDYVEKRVGKLTKFFDNIQEAQVTLLVERDNHVVEVTIPVNGLFLRGEEASPDMYASVDLVVEKLEKQIEKYKTRLSKRLRNLAVKDIVSPRLEEDEDEELPKLMKVKRFAVKPMPVDEAIMQMNLIGHSFFVFANAETEEVNVIYRRKDGNYGLIEPES